MRDVGREHFSKSVIETLCQTVGQAPVALRVCQQYWQPISNIVSLSLSLFGYSHSFTQAYLLPSSFIPAAVPRFLRHSAVLLQSQVIPRPAVVTINKRISSRLYIITLAVVTLWLKPHLG